LLIARLVETLRLLIEEGCVGEGRIIALLEDALQEARRVGLAATKVSHPLHNHGCYKMIPLYAKR